MKIAAETYTVIPPPSEGEIILLIAGLKIVLDLDEARGLTAELIGGMKAACAVERVGERIAPLANELDLVEAPAVAPSLAEAGKPEPKDTLPAVKSKNAPAPLDLPA